MTLFSIIAFLPWILDIGAGRGVLASLFGASLWGAALLLAYARARSHNPPFRRNLDYALAFLSGAWLLYWGISLWSSEGQTAAPLMRSAVLQKLTWAHAALLSAAAAMVLLLLFSALLWQLAELRLKRSSWERRFLPTSLPPLESLKKLSHNALHIAFLCWSAGLILAVLTMYVRYQQLGSSGWSFLAAWLVDPKLQLTLLLWMLLAVGTLIKEKWLVFPRQHLQTCFIVLSLFFFVSFIFLLTGSTQIHAPVKWFTR